MWIAVGSRATNALCCRLRRTQSRPRAQRFCPPDTPGKVPVDVAGRASNALCCGRRCEPGRTITEVAANNYQSVQGWRAPIRQRSRSSVTCFGLLACRPGSLMLAGNPWTTQAGLSQHLDSSVRCVSNVSAVLPRSRALTSGRVGRVSAVLPTAVRLKRNKTSHADKKQRRGSRCHGVTATADPA